MFEFHCHAVDITDQPTNRLKAQWEYAGEKCIIYLQNEANRIHSRWLWAATRLILWRTEKKFLSLYNELLQFVAEKLIDCSSLWTLLFEILFIENWKLLSIPFLLVWKVVPLGPKFFSKIIERSLKLFRKKI